MRKIYMTISAVLSVWLITPNSLFAQGGPCFTGNPAIKLFPFAPDTVGVNQPVFFDIAAVDNTPCADSLYTQSVTVAKLNGPGNVTGILNLNCVKGIVNFNNVFFDAPGDYTLKVSSGTLPDTSFIVHAAVGGGGNPMPNCMEAGPTVKVKFSGVPANVDKDQPFNIDVLAINTNGCVDTTNFSAVSISKLAGSGNINGTLSANFNKGFATFSNISIDASGGYVLLASSSGLPNDTSMNINVNNGGGPGPMPCPPTSSAGKRENMGLFGGSSLDLTFSNTSPRLFAAVSSPASLFYSDDLCLTWNRAFPGDSLEYGCGKGWGGRAVRVLTNNIGWVAVQTQQEAGTLNALVISYNNGDTGTWKTAMDGKMMESLGFQGMSNVSGMGLSDYYMYCLMGKNIIRINNSAPINLANDWIDVSTIHANASATSIAVANTASGYPVYMLVDTTSSMGNSTDGILFKYDGVNFTPIALPAGVGGMSIFTHPGQVTGDTLFLGAMGMMGPKIYRSFDGGLNWADISNGVGNWSLSDIDYSAAWVSSMPASNGCILIIPGSALSTDLGSTWQTIGLQNNGGAMHPQDVTKVVGTMGRGVAVSTVGASGPYTVADNFGLEAVTIKKIARTKSKSVFYLATRAGLAYTTAYSDTTVQGYDKWNAPYGEFPVANVGDDAGVFSVAIDPNDSLHVIAGYSNGFALTTTGIGGFANVMPAGWNNMDDPRANDILFVNSNVVLAVSGGDNQAHVGKGNIWRSADGGASWTKVSPVGFSNGNSIAMGTIGSNTVIYVGTGLYSGVQDDGKLWKSTDLGLNWTFVNDGPTSTTNSSVVKMPIYDLAVDPRGTDTLYIASGSNLDHAFVRSTDGGATYNYVNAHGEGAFTSVAINQTSPDTLYMAIRRDILLYDAINDTAKYIYRGLPGELVPDLAFGSVLAGTSMGFFKIEETVIDEEPTSVKTVASRINMDEIKAYPNPFRNTMNIAFSLEQNSQVKINIYDLMGREVKAIFNGNLSAGQQLIQLRTEDLAAGNYIISLISDNKALTKKVVKID